MGDLESQVVAVLRGNRHPKKQLDPSICLVTLYQCLIHNPQYKLNCYYSQQKAQNKKTWT